MIKMVMMDTNNDTSGVQAINVGDYFADTYGKDRETRDWTAKILSATLCIIHFPEPLFFENEPAGLTKIFYIMDDREMWFKTSKPIFFLKLDSYAAMPLEEDDLAEVYRRICYHKNLQAMEGR